VAACALDAARWVSVGSIANVASGGELTVSDGEGLGSRARLVAGLAWWRVASAEPNKNIKKSCRWSCVTWPLVARAEQVTKKHQAYCYTAPRS
jgi:hypothetical protein